MWALDPGTLNEDQFGLNKIFLQHDKDIEDLYNPCRPNVIDNPINKVAAVQPEHFDLRHMTQLAAATIHGSAISINQIHQSSKCLAKILIPHQIKSRVREMLNMYGITKSSIFPDLDNLASQIKQDYTNKVQIPPSDTEP